MNTTCKLEEVFDFNFIELLRLVPNNPIVRGLILRITGKSPAPECTTFEQIKSWVEANCNIGRRPTYRKSESTPGIHVNVSFSEKEHGVASYSGYRSGTEEFPIGAGELVDMVQEVIGSGGGIDEIVEAVERLIDEEAWERCEPELDGSDNDEYYDHNCNDTTDTSTDYSSSEIRDEILRFLRALHPELASELET